MKYYIIAGEASGDLHGSNLIKEIKLLDKEATVRCWGGDMMQQQGANVVKHYRDLSFMGFTEVLTNIRAIFRNIAFCKKDITAFSPDVLILIDYPGFNLRIAKYAKQKGLKVFYYISPQLWAWKQSRVHQIKRCVDKMFVILPFEEEFYKKFDYDVEFVGHPLLDAIEQYTKNGLSLEVFTKKHQLSNKPIIAILPGSRKQEISTMLPIMLDRVKDFQEYQFIVAAAPSITKEFYHQFIPNENVKILYANTYQLLQHSSAAMVTSGTATLETALFEVPEVVCYKAGFISYHIAKKLVKVDYISLVNLIMEKQIVKELIQKDFNNKQLKKELDALLYDNSYRMQMIENYRKLKLKLGGIGASKRAAEKMLITLSE